VKLFIDSDILIWHLRGKEQALRFLRTKSREKDHELFVGAMQRAEVVFFMRPEEEKQTTDFLELFNTEPLTREIVDLAGTYYRKFNASHSIDINDALLAATCATRGGMIFTLNKKHYPMKDVVVGKPW
jgi:predicted nucleic acid-binding protein